MDLFKQRRGGKRRGRRTEGEGRGKGEREGGKERGGGGKGEISFQNLSAKRVQLLVFRLEGASPHTLVITCHSALPWPCFNLPSESSRAHSLIPFLLPSGHYEKLFSFTRQTLKSEAKGKGEMVQWVKVLAAKPDDLSFIPGTHMTEGEN